MKKLSFIFTFLFLSPSAFSRELPESFCSPLYYDCTEKQLQIVEKFRNVGYSPELPIEAGVYAGSCYALGQGYDPAHEHHGFIYIRNEGPHFTFNGQFSFFAEQNPYSNITLEEAHREYPVASPYVLEKRVQDWFVMIDTNINWHYFIRETAPQQMTLIGLWGPSRSILCEFTTKEVR